MYITGQFVVSERTGASTQGYLTATGTKSYKLQEALGVFHRVIHRHTWTIDMHNTDYHCCETMVCFLLRETHKVVDLQQQQQQQAHQYIVSHNLLVFTSKVTPKNPMWCLISR
jgi:hypothetical protein